MTTNSPQASKQPYKRTTVYVPKQDYHKLRIKLLEQNKTVSGWFQEMITKLLKNNQ